jgi:hypothetical protein
VSAVEQFIESERLAQPVRGIDVPASTRERWAEELEAERALASATQAAEKDARGVQAADDLATTKNYYIKARNKVEADIETLTASMEACAELRVAYENRWSEAADYDVQDERLASLNAGDVHRTILSLGGRV